MNDEQTTQLQNGDPQPDIQPQQPLPSSQPPVQASAYPETIAASQDYPASSSPVSYNNALISASVSPWNDAESRGGLFGFISLGLGLLSVIAFMIFSLGIFSSLFKESLTGSIIWSIIILLIAAGGIAMGILSEKGKDKINLYGLMGIITATVMAIFSLFVAAYLIKAQIEINKAKAKFESSSSSSSYR